MTTTTFASPISLMFYENNATWLYALDYLPALIQWKEMRASDREGCAMIDVRRKIDVPDIVICMNERRPEIEIIDDGLSLPGSCDWLTCYEFLPVLFISIDDQSFSDFLFYLCLQLLYIRVINLSSTIWYLVIICVFCFYISFILLQTEMQFEKFYYKFVKKMYFERWWLVLEENMRRNRWWGETPTAIITPRSTGDLIACVLHKIRLPRNRRWRVSIRLTIEVSLRAKWFLRSILESFILDTNYVCRSFPLLAIYCDCDAVILPRSNKDRISITLSFQYSINQVAINRMHDISNLECNFFAR